MDRKQDRTAPSGVFNIAAGLSFVDRLAQTLITGRNHSPWSLTDTLILLPNRRSVRALAAAFVRHCPEQALLMPRIAALGDVEEDEAEGSFADDVAGLDSTLPAGISTIERILALTPAVRVWLRRTGRSGASLGYAIELARALGRTLDQLMTEDVSPDKLRTAVPADAASHWDTSLTFLEMILTNWPATLKKLDRIDAADRRNRLLRALARRWREQPPRGRVIAAGTTGSIPATAALLRVICRMPEGAVILPGLDRTLAEAVWDGLPPTHPQFGLRALLGTLGIKRGEVQEWPGPSPSPQADRLPLLQKAMLPPEDTANWLHRPTRPAAARGIRHLVAGTPAEEAQAVCLALRQALQTPGRTALVVTADSGLAQRIIRLMRRNGIAIDSSAGERLARQPTAVYLRTLARLWAENWPAQRLLALLKHPLCGGAAHRQDIRQLAHWLDRDVLRRHRAAAGVAGIAEAMARLQAGASGRTVPQSWAIVTAALAPLTAQPTDRAAPFELQLERLLAAAEGLSDSASLWSQPGGRALAQQMASIRAAPEPPGLATATDLADALDALLADAVVRPAYGQHPRLRILSPIEARLQSADLMVLAGLNEGVWPAEDVPDPWLSPGLRRALGLPTLERRIGQSAHDFVQAVAGGTEVLLTRAARSGGSPTVPSRLWLRLQAVSASQWAHADDLLGWARAMDHPAKVVPTTQPAPAPPRRLRPRRISVTQVEELLRNPYGIYARRILRLEPLPPLGGTPDARERGTIIHTAMEDWLKDTAPAARTPAALVAAFERVVAPLHLDPLFLRWWQGRIERIAAWAAGRLESEATRWTPAHYELQGEIERCGITLSGVADRLDRNPEGQWRIIDYKTGQPPSMEQWNALYAPQLPLLALIAEHGGFATLGAAPSIAGLEYWRLGGGRSKPGETASRIASSDKARHQSVAEAVADAARVFDEAIAQYLLGDAPFRAEVQPKFMKGKDYQQLARVKEWRTLGDD